MVRVPDLEAINRMIADFERLKRPHRGGEVWSGRDLMEFFQYKSWQKFKGAIERAEAHILGSKADPSEQLIRVDEEIEKAKGARGVRENIYMTRYGAYMLMQELSIKDSVLAAFAKSYFSVQTRVAEVIQKDILDINDRIKSRSDLRTREKSLSDTLWERGVNTAVGIATVRSEGDRALFGKPTRMMKKQMGADGKPLANRLHTINIKAKELTAAMTVHNAEDKDLHGQYSLESEHVVNNMTIRDALGKRGIKPEDLPPGEDTEKLERQSKKAEQDALRAAGASRQLFMKSPEPVPDPPLEIPTKSSDGGEQQVLPFD